MVSPVPYLHKLSNSGRPFFVVSGRYDPTFLMEYTDRMFAMLDELNVPHERLVLAMRTLFARVSAIQLHRGLSAGNISVAALDVKKTGRTGKLLQRFCSLPRLVGAGPLAGGWRHYKFCGLGGSGYFASINCENAPSAMRFATASISRASERSASTRGDTP